VQGAARLETRVPLRIEDGPAVVVEADADQVEQALINLVRNAADASLETGGAVRVGWRAGEREAEVFIEDEGHGLPPSANLFVPFFTTKQQGSGIGLVLSRQIAEGHGGSLSLANRDGALGCVARLRLPL
jgi:signal transduction histidine kinase